jgi:DnaK suppressor protein
MPTDNKRRLEGGDTLPDRAEAARRQEVKPQPKAAAKAQKKPVAKAKPVKAPAKAKPVAKSSAKPAAKPAAKKPAKPVAKPAAKAAVKAKPAPKKVPVKPTSRPAAKPAAKPVAKAVKPAAKAASKPASKAAAKPVSKPSAAPKAKAGTSMPAKKGAAKAAPSKPAAKAVPPSAAKSVAKAKAPVAKAPAKKAAPAPARPAPAAAPSNPVAAAPAVAGSTPPRATRPSARLVQITVPSMAQSVASTAAKASYIQTPSPSLPVKKDPKLANNWKTKSADQLSDAEVLAMPDGEYMNDKQMAFFRLKLMRLKQDILNSAGETTEHLREDTVIVPDPADRATIEEEHALELRTRDRERKLLKKIEQSIVRIDAGDYGYCDETGEPIGVGRLLARPTATLSLEAQQRRELKQKMFGD